MKKYISVALCIFLSFSLSAQEIDESGGPLHVAARAMRDRRYREAEEIYRSILRQTPGDVSVNQMLCHALICENKFLEADSSLRRMVEADSNNIGNYWYMGLSAGTQNIDSVAIVCYKTYLRKSENNPNQKVKAWLYVGSSFRRIMHKQGLSRTQFDDMLFYYKRYLKLNPNDVYAGEVQKFIDSVSPKRPEEGAILMWDETN